VTSAPGGGKKGGKLPVMLTLAVLGVVLALMSWPTQPAPKTSSASPPLPPPPSSPVAPNAWFVYLVDLSGSVGRAGRASDSPIERVLQRLDSLLLATRKLEEFDTQESSVLLIGSGSLYQTPLCTFVMSRGSIFDPAHVTQDTVHARQCVDSLRRRTAAPFTDIRGALKLAGMYLAGRQGLIRGVTVISDLVENVPAGQELAVPDLSGVCVLLLPVLTPADVERPSAFDKRGHQWREYATSWGARDVAVTAATVATDDAIASFFRSCYRRRTPTPT
jgi:hypothetical protein